jgi:hypothetical protein
VACTCLIATPCAAAWVGTFLSYSRETQRTEIYRGVFYESRRLTNGLAHIVEVQLDAPGIELYLTPVHSEALASGHEYRLDYVRNIARAEGLAVAINGSMFSSDSYLIPMVGDFATSRDSIVADHKLNHLNPRNYFFWFDEGLAPHIEKIAPVPLAALQRAKWAMGAIDLADGDLKPKQGDVDYDARTLIGLDPEHKKLWFGVFESATLSKATLTLIEAGARYVMSLDGGESTSLYFGGRTRGVQHGLRVGGQRPVATMIGVKADPILDPL